MGSVVEPCKFERTLGNLHLWRLIVNFSPISLFFSAGRTVGGTPNAAGGSSGAGTPTGSGSSTNRFTTGQFPRNVPSRSTFHSGQNRPRNQAATYGGAAGGGMAGADSSGLGPSSRTSFFSKLSSRFSKR